MIKDYEIIRQLSVGEILNKYKNNGTFLTMSELLLSEDLKVQLFFNEENNTMQMVVLDENISLPSFVTNFSKETLKTWIQALRVFYGQMDQRDKEEVSK